MAAPRASAWILFRKTVSAYSEDKAPRLGAALAYYTALSLAPLLLVVIGIAGLALGDEAARGQIVGQLRGLTGVDGAKAIEDMLAHSADRSSGLLATLVGTVTLLAGASGVFGQLQDALNTVWEVELKTSRGWLNLIKDRFVSLAMVFGVGFLLLVSLVLSAAIALASEWFHNRAPGFEALAYFFDLVLSIGATTALFAMIFKYLPDADVRWSDVWLGALVTAVLFAIGKFAIGLYLGHASIGSSYGAAGSFVVLLVWIYYSTQILLFGAEFTWVWATEHGRRPKAAEDSTSSA